MTIKISEESKETSAVIKVIGVGGAGGNAVNRMAKGGLRGVQLIAANSDAQDLRRSEAEILIQLGETGLGVGGDPGKGRAVATESEGQIQDALAGADMVFVTAGMGGGTGTGGAPVVARLAKAAGALTIGVVTRPFRFEGPLRDKLAEEGIQELRQSVDTLLIIPNNRLLDAVEKNTPTDEAFRLVDDVLRIAVQSISDVITTSGNINMDLNDLRAIMTDSGEALIGFGEATGADRALQAAKDAVTSPLLENVNIAGAKGLMVNITSRKSKLTLDEFNEVMCYIQPHVSPEAKVKFGMVLDDTLGESLRITVIATRLTVQPRRTSIPRLSRLPVKAGPVDWNKPAYQRLTVRKLK